MNVTFPPTTRLRPSARLVGILLAAITILGLFPLPVYGQDGPPASARIDNIRHIFQSWNNCGPANLTMAMSHYGWGYDQRVAGAWLKPNIEDKNVSPGQMAAYVNQQTELPIRALWRYGGNIQLLKKFIAAGFPVIIESGYDVEDLGWMGHYETIVAYDDASETFWVYDSYLGIGNGFGREHRYEELDSWWRHFNRTYVVVFPLDRENEVREILGPFVDPLFAAQSALSVARQEAAQDQTDAWAWFNAGTSATRLGQYYDAAIYFDEAFRQGLPYRLLWYMFGPYEAYYNIARYDDVVTLTNNTEATTVYVEETNYWRGMAYAAQGRTDDAIAQLDAALRFNRNFTPAADAKTLIESGEYVSPGAPQ